MPHTAASRLIMIVVAVLGSQCVGSILFVNFRQMPLSTFLEEKKRLVPALFGLFVNIQMCLSEKKSLAALRIRNE